MLENKQGFMWCPRCLAFYIAFLLTEVNLLHTNQWFNVTLNFLQECIERFWEARTLLKMDRLECLASFLLSGFALFLLQNPVSTQWTQTHQADSQGCLMRPERSCYISDAVLRGIGWVSELRDLIKSVAVLCNV